MNEFEDEIIEGLAKANITLNEIKIALKGFIAKMEALQPDLEYDSPERTKQIKGMDHVLEMDLGLKPQTRVEETIEVDSGGLTTVYEGRTYNKFKPCKYKCGYWTSWATDYKKGDKILHINPVTKEVLGFNCPKFKGGK